MSDKRPSDPEAQQKFSGRESAAGGGDSGGGAYPNPHTGKKPESGGYMGHGGQTEMAYHGTGQLGEDKVGENANAPTRKTRPGEDKGE
jgi:hypothetical protein